MPVTSVFSPVAKQKALDEVTEAGHREIRFEADRAVQVGDRSLAPLSIAGDGIAGNGADRRAKVGNRVRLKQPPRSSGNPKGALDGVRYRYIVRIYARHGFTLTKLDSTW